ncbi:MAG: transketolase [Vicinamibacteria bacterium]
MSRLDSMSIEELTIATIRCLAMDAVEEAKSGHPGTPMALAPAAYVLWSRFLRHDPSDPNWIDRDRFVLSNGHASMLLYAMLHLTGYELALEDIRQFRQWGSKTPGHPEHGVTPGVETTTGPLGQGFMNAVGMAMAEAQLAAVYNREGHPILDHYTYVFTSDGDLMEGASHEAASLAGHLGLGKLVCLYDDNHITIEGKTELTFSDDHRRRFEGYGWQVIHLGESGNDVSAITAGFEEARRETARPSLIILRTHIAYGSPNFQDKKEAHGSPLGEEEVRRTKRVYGWPEDAKFLVPDRVREHTEEAKRRAPAPEWASRFESYKKEHPDLAARLESALEERLPEDWASELPRYDASMKPIATRKASGQVINALARKIDWLVGGSGDLAPSTYTFMEVSGYFERERYENRNFAWGVREHVMVAASTGLSLHGGVRPFCASFLIFTDYARPAIRLAALMKQPVIYVMTHDSIALGEDGPTHQPVEHLASLRAIPDLCVIRPCDAAEVVWAWRTALETTDAPTLLALSRQELPILDRDRYAPAQGLRHGAYVLSPESGEAPELILMASGSEVHLLLEAQERLVSEGIQTRVVSFPSWELFREQSADYRRSVLPTSVRARLAVEAASPQGWCEWVGAEGEVVGVTTFGASAAGKEVWKHYGFTVDRVLARARSLISERRETEGA